MKLLFLGTGAGEGYPGRWCECPNCAYARAHRGRNLRANSSAMLDDALMLDMNGATFDNAARFGAHPSRAHTLLITHPHEDHLYPQELFWRRGRTDATRLNLDGLQALGSAPRFTPLPPMTIVGNGYAEDLLLRAYPDSAAMEYEFHRVEPGDALQSHGYRITALRGNHVRPGYTTNYIVEKDGKSLLYALDTGGYDEDMRDILRRQRLDLVVMEGTGGLSSCGDGHMCLEKNEFWRKWMLENGVIAPDTPFVLTHLSPHWTPPHDRFADIAAQRGMTAAWDGMEIEI